MPGTNRKHRKDAKLTVRLSKFEQRRLDFIRTHRLPSGAAPRPAAQCAVEAILRLADILEHAPPAVGPNP